MKDFPKKLINPVNLTVDDSVSESDIIAVQEKYIKPVLGAALYEDFMNDPEIAQYSKLKLYCVNCVSAWTYYHTFDRKILFKNFLDNSAESPLMNMSTKDSAHELAVASTEALKSHVASFGYPLYVPSSTKRMGGFLIRK